MDSRLRIFAERGFYKSCLESIAIPRRVHEIGEECFASTSLSSVTFAVDGCLSVIHKSAFEGAQLQAISLPKSLRRLEDRCFAHNRNLETVVFLEDSEIEFIGVHCFQSGRIMELVLPSTVRNIGYGAWSGVKKVAIDPANTHFSADGKFLLSADGDTVCSLLTKME